MAYRDLLPNQYQNCQRQTLLIIAILLLVMILCILLASLFYTLWLQREITNPFAPIFARATATSSAPTAIPPNTDAWEIIRKKGKITVGVSADYPPFAYVAPDFSLQGYDIALAQEIGKRLNLPVEFTNIAFDGLFPALQLHQIDMAVAAISVTPERAAVVDFTNMYYLGEDAVVARAESPIQIAKLEDLAKFRVGVQRGSVYQTLLQSRLVTPGLMAPPLLTPFDTALAALNSLAGSAPAVDLVMMDHLPATSAIQGRPLRIIQHGMTPQGYAIAVPKGSAQLQGYLNVVLGMLQNDGTLQRLARQYFRIETVPVAPTPTSIPPVVQTPIPPSPAACIDGMEFVTDLNYPDGNMTSPAIFTPGQAFQKSWRIRNVGTCTWDGRYALAYTGASPSGSPVGGNPAVIGGTVPPGSTYDISVALTAPLQAGRYQSFWSMRGPGGAYFGNRLWVGMDVVTTPGPTSPPQPPGPIISAFTSTPQQIQLGQCVNLSWNYTTAAPAQARLFRGPTLLLQDLPSSGRYIDCPDSAGQIEYRLVVDLTGGGSSTATQLVSVFPGTPPTVPVQPTAPPQALIRAFTGSSAEIVWGNCVTLSWVYLGGTNITAAELFRNDRRIGQGLQPTASLSDCPPTWGLMVYRLTVTSSNAGSTSATFYVNVKPLSGLRLAPQLSLFVPAKMR